MRFAELEFSVEYGLGRAPPSGSGSNAPRPAMSVPHIDVNADGCRARRASVEEEFWKIVESQWLQRLNDLQNWHHSQTVRDAIRGGTGILGRIWLGSSAAFFGGRLQRPSPCRVRSVHRRERGRVPSETSECRGGILEKLLNLNGCNA